ncbi:MAG: hypothetical protein D6766_01315 [Verrucomicrobia bacterium]|nr:MAG: hypothetical protein D6766_01315 [Verrucomicrobiota bacterium]
MAVDEALLRTARPGEPPWLRVYAWREPAASFGLLQRAETVRQWTELRPLVRRPTGGGLVPHADDWTYSVVIPAGHPWHRLRAPESYRRLHRWLQVALARLGVPTELAPEPIADGPGRCFVGAEANDLLWQGRKIAGAAQRRTRTGLLIQGSVQPPPPGVERLDWERALQESAAELWGVRWTPAAMEPQLREAANRLLAARYRRYGDLIGPLRP